MILAANTFCITSFTISHIQSFFKDSNFSQLDSHLLKGNFRGTFFDFLQKLKRIFLSTLVRSFCYQNIEKTRFFIFIFVPSCDGTVFIDIVTA